MSLFELIKSGLEYKGRDDLLSLFAETVLYLIRVNTAFEYQDAIRDCCFQKSPKEFRLALIADRYFVLDIKLFTLALGKFKSPTTADVRGLRKQYGITSLDAKHIYNLFLECNWFRKDIKTAAKPLERWQLCPKEIQRDFSDVYAALEKFVKSRVYRKLTFISKSENTPYADLVSEIMVPVLTAYYKLVPTTQDLPYIENYLKRSAQNRITNFIKAHTTQARGRLVNTGEQDANGAAVFNLLCVSQNQRAVTVGEDGEVLDVDAEDTDNSITKFEVRFSIDELLSKVRKGSKKHTFLLLMLGNEDLEFTQFLRDKGVASKTQDNCDVQERLTVKQYNVLVAEYLNTPVYKIENYLNKIGTQLAAYA